MPEYPVGTTGAMPRRRFLVASAATVALAVSVGFADPAGAREDPGQSSLLRIEVLESGSDGDVAGMRACASDSAKNFIRVRFSGQSSSASTPTIDVRTPGWFNPVDGDVGTILETPGWSVAAQGLSGQGQTWSFASSVQPSGSVDWELIVRFQLSIGLAPATPGTVEGQCTATLGGSKAQASTSVAVTRDTDASVIVESVTSAAGVVTGSTQPLNVILVNQNAAPGLAVAFTVDLGDGLAFGPSSSPDWTVAQTSSSRYLVSATSTNTIRAYERRIVALPLLAIADTQSDGRPAGGSSERNIYVYTSDAAGAKLSESNTSITRQL